VSCVSPVASLPDRRSRALGFARRHRV